MFIAKWLYTTADRHIVQLVRFTGRSPQWLARRSVGIGAAVSAVYCAYTAIIAPWVLLFAAPAAIFWYIFTERAVKESVDVMQASPGMVPDHAARWAEMNFVLGVLQGILAVTLLSVSSMFLAFEHLFYTIAILYASHPAVPSSSAWSRLKSATKTFVKGLLPRPTPVPRPVRS